jgi:hypothetical protein
MLRHPLDSKHQVLKFVAAHMAEIRLIFHHPAQQQQDQKEMMQMRDPECWPHRTTLS